jgi:hypothetical protein
MANLVPFFPSAAFDHNATRAMGKAFDRACHSLHDIGQPDLVREIIAKRIIEAARDGERDPDQLCVRALKALGFSSFSNRQSFDRPAASVDCLRGASGAGPFPCPRGPF